MTKLEEIQRLIEIMHQDGVWDVSPYTHGMLNGLIVAEGILLGVPSDSVDFIDPPEQYLQDVEDTAIKEELVRQEYDLMYQKTMALAGWSPIW